MAYRVHLGFFFYSIWERVYPTDMTGRGKIVADLWDMRRQNGVYLGPFSLSVCMETESKRGGERLRYDIPPPTILLEYHEEYFQHLPSLQSSFLDCRHSSNCCKLISTQQRSLHKAQPVSRPAQQSCFFLLMSTKPSNHLPNSSHSRAQKKTNPQCSTLAFPSPSTNQYDSPLLPQTFN